MVLEIVVIESIPRLVEVTAVAATTGLAGPIAVAMGLGIVGIALLGVSLVLLFYV